MLRTSSLLGVTVLFVLFVLVSRASAGWIINNSAGPTNTLYDYTPGGGATNPRNVTGIVNSGAILVGIDFSGAGDLFALTSTNDNRLYKVNPATAVATPIGTGTGGILIEGDMGFDPTTGILYGLFNVAGSGNQLFTVNTTTGVLTNIGAVTSDDPSGLALDNAGNLFVVDTNVNTTHLLSLLRINKLTGATITTQSTGVSGTIASVGLDFDSTINTLYMAAANGNFYSINTTTGTATFLGSHGLTGATGLAFVIPEPASAALLLAAAVPLVAGRRRGSRVFSC